MNIQDYINIFKLIIIIYILLIPTINFNINNFLIKLLSILIIIYTINIDISLTILLIFAFLLNIHYNNKKLIDNMLIKNKY
jgi:hypothetical protein